jgi:hypothetical protein
MVLQLLMWLILQATAANLTAGTGTVVIAGSTVTILADAASSLQPSE